MKSRVIILIAIQAGFMLCWAGWNEYQWYRLPSVKLELAPVDPKAIMRGRYFILNPVAQRIDAAELVEPFTEELLRRKAMPGAVPLTDEQRPRFKDGTLSPIEFQCPGWIGQAWLVLQVDEHKVARPARLLLDRPASLRDGQVALYSRASALQSAYYDSSYVRPQEVAPAEGLPKNRYGATISLDFSLRTFYLPSRLQLPHAEYVQGWLIEVVLRPDFTAGPKALWFGDERVYP